eukprot:757846-Hanusia_phi.AAC.1
MVHINTVIFEDNIQWFLFVVVTSEVPKFRSIQVRLLLPVIQASHRVVDKLQMKCVIKLRAQTDMAAEVLYVQVTHRLFGCLLRPWICCRIRHFTEVGPGRGPRALTRFSERSARPGGIQRPAESPGREGGSSESEARPAAARPR